MTNEMLELADFMEQASGVLLCGQGEKRNALAPLTLASQNLIVAALRSTAAQADLLAQAALSMTMALKAWDAYGGFDTREQTAIKANAMAEAIRSALAALPSSPAPDCSSLNSGESEPSVTMVSGAGDPVATIDSVPSCGQENDYQRAALLKP